MALMGGRQRDVQYFMEDELQEINYKDIKDKINDEADDGDPFSFERN